ncbi:hypothetical protein [Corallococcus sp. RDP092CA]|uniref:hypothetical protein n=1 Tax=Corallococcus sp. RDP092CA TaxID=3109369 RepID=UPI0035B14A8E
MADIRAVQAQVDRLLSNEGFNVWKLFGAWVPFVLAERTAAVIALDWTDFEKDDQESLVASLVTRHGRATPLRWTTLVKSASAGNRQLTEDLVLQRLRELIPSHVQVTVLADRGFADAKFYALLKQLDFEYVVRFRSDMLVTSEEGETKPATQWVPEGDRAKVLLTLLGAAGEALGYDKHLKVNTAKKRPHSLFTQGTDYFMAMPRMSDDRLRPLVERFGQLVREHSVFQEAFGFI